MSNDGVHQGWFNWKMFFFYFHADNLWCKQIEFSLCTLSSSLSQEKTEIQKFPYADGVGSLTKTCIASNLISSYFCDNQSHQQISLLRTEHVKSAICFLRDNNSSILTITK